MIASAASCGDQGVAPRDIAPGHAALSVQPLFDALPPGGPQIPLSRIKGVLTAPNGDSTVAEARFVDGQAELPFDVTITGGSAEFTLDLTAYDVTGAVAFTARQKYTLRPGNNASAPAPTLKYAGLDAGLGAITVAPATLSLAAGATGSLSASGTLSGGVNITPPVGWTSSDPTIATVDANGIVTAGQSQGSATITATSATGLTAQASVKVSAPVDKVVAAPESVQVFRGATSTVKAQLLDATGHVIDDRAATWTSSDPSIASVSSTGAVTGVKIGKTTVTATAEGKTATVPVTVVSPVGGVQLAPTSVQFSSLSDNSALAVKIVPATGANVDGLSLTFTTSDSRVVTVDSKGVLTAIGNGSAKVTGEIDGFSASVDVVVLQAAAVLSTTPKAMSVSAVGQAATFTVAVVDARGNPIVSPVVAWSSSNESIATVTGTGATGTVTAKQSGTVTISATSNGKTDAVTFTVAPVVSMLLLEADNTQINVGQTASLSAKWADANGNAISDATATFSTTTPNIASVSGSIVTGLSGGVARIVATSGARTAALDITVVNPSGGSGLILSPATAEKLPGGTQLFTVTSGGTGPFTWTVNGIQGGNSTFGTINVDGFYTAPAAVPSPSSFDVCASQSQPALQGCARVTISPIPSGGADVIVINDMNLMQDGFITTADNRKFFQNIVAFTPTGTRASATRVMFQYGHNSQCGNDGGCTASQNGIMRTDMLAAGASGFIDDTSQTLGTIPSDVKVLFLETPTTNYSVAELNTLKLFAAQGGRIVFIGENGGYYGTGIPIENALLLDLGGQLTNEAALASCSFGWNIGAANLRPHQVTTGVTSLYVPCASPIDPGVNDYPIAFNQRDSDGALVPVIAVAKIDLTPIVGSPAPFTSLFIRKPAAARTGVVDRTGLGPRVKPQRP